MNPPPLVFPACQTLRNPLDSRANNSREWTMPSGTEMAERLSAGYYQPRATFADATYRRQAFHHPRTSLGAAGHWVHLLGVAAPVVIGEVITDPNNRWRAMRLAAVGTALLSEAAWTLRLMKERKKDEESHAALEACHNRGR